MKHNNRRKAPALLLACVVVNGGFNFAAIAATPAGIGGALDEGKLGIDSARDYRLSDGKCADCSTPPQALWYFRGDTIAVPAQASFDPHLSAQDDVRNWARAHPAGDNSKAPLIWLGSPQLASGVRLGDDGKTLIGADGGKMPFAVVPKLPTHPSYYDASSERHFAGRSLRLRGRMEDGRFIARTIWPQDYALDFARLPYQPLAAGETLSGLVRAEGGGARLPLAARVVWQRDAQAPRAWAGKAVVAIMVNGAQGDDDEAHGGHFAIATGAFGEHGEWHDWLVNNFYNLDSISEKGIIASTLPMDNYLADLNSGQSWYRPSYMLVGVLRTPRAASLYQAAADRVFAHFYRHDFIYRHADLNCAGISMQTLRSLGWNIPREGPTSRVKAAIGLPYMALKNVSLESGRDAYDYMITEKSELFPLAAFEAAGRDLLGRITRGGAADGYEGVLGADLEALIYVRIPQLPSSRAFGAAPVGSIDEYTARVPADKAQWKIIPVSPRPFPPEFKDPAAPAQAPLPSLYALYAYGAAVVLLGLWLIRFLMRRRK